MSQENVEIVRRAVAAMSDGDADGVAALCSPDVVLSLQGALGEPVRYLGIAGIHEFFKDMGESWESFGFDLEEARDLGERVLIIGAQWGRGRASGAGVRARRAGVISLQEGVVSELRYFLELEGAFKLVGLAE